MISEFWNSPEFFFCSCFYDGVELISVMTIYCSLLYWIIVCCLLLSLTLGCHLLSLFSIFSRHFPGMSFCCIKLSVLYKLFQTSGNFTKFCQGNQGIIKGFFLALGWEPWIWSHFVKQWTNCSSKVVPVGFAMQIFKISNVYQRHSVWFFFCMGFLSWTFTMYRTAAKGGGYFFNSSLLPPLTSQTLKH